MKKWIVTFCSIAFLLLFILQQQGESKRRSSNQANTIGSDYISVAEYFELHPEEQDVSRKFSQIVSTEADPVALAAQRKKIKIGIVYPGKQVSDYWRRSLQSFEGRLHELQIPYEIRQHFTKGGGLETRIQAKLLKEALAEDPDYLVFTLDVYRHKGLIERILAKGKPRLFLQNITTPLAVWEDNQPFYVGFDHTLGSGMLADYFLDTYGSHGSYGLLYYSQGYVSRMRGDSFLYRMQQGHGPVLAASFYTDGSRDKARAATVSGLNMVKDLKFIYACSTDVAFGAVDGLKDGGLAGKVAVNGWGGGEAELAALTKGDLDVTVMRMNDDNGVAMAEAIRLELLGRRAEVPTIFSGEFVLVTQKTSAAELKTLKQKAFRYSGVPGVQ